MRRIRPGAHFATRSFCGVALLAALAAATPSLAQDSAPAAAANAAPAAVNSPPAAAANAAPSAAGGSRVRLVLQITIDQLRPDVLLRDRRLWGRDGFARLFGDGAVFDEADHAHANTETLVGHATLATGADPSAHGLVGNGWLDRTTGKLRSSVEDCDYEVVGEAKSVAAPAAASTPPAPFTSAAPPSIPSAPPRTAKCAGRSPAALLAPTIADSIDAAGGGRAKVFSVSLKDRAAIPMAGRAGRAFWWSDASGRFVTSTYYYPGRRLPAWADAWDRRGEADRIDGRAWNLLVEPASRYVEAGHDDEPWEAPPAGMTRTFPHRFDRKALGAGFLGAVETSPFGDELLLGFAKELVASEQLGRDDVTDYLSVSFSSSDYIGHRFGPDSLEVEDEVLRLDRSVAALLAAADDAAGPGHTLVVLSSDHGVLEPVDQLLASRRDSGRVSLAAVEASAPVRDLTERFGGSLILGRAWPYVYLDVDSLRRHGVDTNVAAAALADELRKVKGIGEVYTRAEIEARASADDNVLRAVKRNFQAERSGDLHLVPKQDWQVSFDTEMAGRYVANHGSPWEYDTHVPLVFAGPGVARVEVGRRVETVDVAPTLAALAGVAAPAKASGRVLREAIATAVAVPVAAGSTTPATAPSSLPN